MKPRTLGRITSPIMYTVHYSRPMIRSVAGIRTHSIALRRQLNRGVYSLDDVLCKKINDRKDKIEHRLRGSSAYSPWFYERYFVVLDKSPNHLQLKYLNKASFKNYQKWNDARDEFDKIITKQRAHQKLCEKHGIYDIHNDEAKMIIALSD